jgi:acyl carrier protein
MFDKIQMIEIFNNVLGKKIDHLDGDINLFNEGILDSFNILAVISEIETKFGVQFKMDDLVAENFESINSLLGLLNNENQR